jgi:hypothetical protein
VKVARSECTTCNGTGIAYSAVAVTRDIFGAQQACRITCPNCYDDTQEQPVNDKIKVEPDAEMRRNAFVLRQWFIALVDQGFTEDEALRIIGSQIGGK